MDWQVRCEERHGIRDKAVPESGILSAKSCGEDVGRIWVIQGAASNLGPRGLNPESRILC
jgi:hypothetical protein